MQKSILQLLLLRQWIPMEKCGMPIDVLAKIWYNVDIMHYFIIKGCVFSMKSAKSYHIMQFTLEELCLGGQTKSGKLRLNAEILKTLLFPKIPFVLRSEMQQHTVALDYASKAAISIPYNAALRQIYILREEERLAQKPESEQEKEKAEILGSAYAGPSNSDYFLQDIIYVDLNIHSGGKELVESLLNGLEIEYDRMNSKTNTYEKNIVSYTVFERSASQQRQNMLVMIRSDLFAEEDALQRRIRCGIAKDDDVIISKYSAYRALMLTSGICIDAKEYLNQDSVLVVSDYMIKNWTALCRKYNIPYDEHDTKNCATVRSDTNDNDPLLRNIRYADEDKNILKDKLFDGEGLISPDFASLLSHAIFSDKKAKAASYQIRMPFVKGVVHTVDFHRIFREIFGNTADLEQIQIRDAFGKLRAIGKVHLILTVSMFKMFNNYKKVKIKMNGFDEYWKHFCEGEHRLFVSGCDEIFRTAPNYTITNYQFLSTLEHQPEKLPEIVSPSLNAVWTASQSIDSWRAYSLLRARIPLDLLEGGSDETEERTLSFKEKREAEEEISDIRLLQRCPQLAYIPAFKKKVSSDQLREDLSIGHLIQPGAMRYLSGDLLQFCCILADRARVRLALEDTKEFWKKIREIHAHRRSVLEKWMLEACDGIVPLHTDTLDHLFEPDANGQYPRLSSLVSAVHTKQDTWQAADASPEETDFFHRMKLAFRSAERALTPLPEAFFSSDAFTCPATVLDRKKSMNQWLFEAGISGTAYYAPGASPQRAAIDRNPHLARNEHVVLDPLVSGTFRETYFSNLTGVLMLRVGRDCNVQRLGGADFDGDIVRLFYDPAYIAAAEDSCTLRPLVIPSAKAKEEKFDGNARCELVRRSSGSRVGSFSNTAYCTSLLAYAHRTGFSHNLKKVTAEESVQQSQHDLVKLSCMVGMEIDAVKAGKKPEYLPKDLFVFQRYPKLKKKEDPAALNYFLDYKDYLKKKKDQEKLRFSAISAKIGEYSLVENLPYIFNPQKLHEIHVRYDAGHWAEQCHRLLWEEKNTGKKSSAVRKFSSRNDALTQFQPKPQYLYQLCADGTNAVQTYRLTTELKAAYDAACALEKVEGRNVNSTVSAKLHVIRRLLTGYFGLSTGNRCLQEIRDAVTKMTDEKQILEMIFQLLPWGSYPNAELRRVRFNLLCQEEGIDFYTNQNDDFDVLLCNLDRCVHDHDQLLKIVLKYPVAELLAEVQEATFPDPKPQVTGMLPAGFDADALVQLRDAFWELNTMSALQQTAESIMRGTLPFNQAAAAYGLRIPEENTLLRILLETWDDNARSNIYNALTTLPSARKQADKILCEMIRSFRKPDKNADPSVENAMQSLQISPDNSSEQQAYAKLWEQLARVCTKVHTAEPRTNSIMTDDRCRKIAEKIYQKPEINWIAENDENKRQKYVQKLLGKTIWEKLKNPMQTILCKPEYWQLLPAMLHYARSVSAANARNENRKRFQEETREIFHSGAYPYAVVCCQENGNRNDWIEAVREVMTAYQSMECSEETEPNPIAVAGTKETIELLMQWPSMPQDSVAADETQRMVIFRRSELHTAQKDAEAEEKSQEDMDQEDMQEAETADLFVEETVSDKVMISKLTADLYRLLRSCKIRGLKRQQKIRLMLDTIYAMQSQQNEDAGQAVFSLLLGEERYAAEHPEYAEEKPEAWENFICNYYAHCLYEALPENSMIFYEKQFQPNYACGFVDGSQGIRLCLPAKSIGKGPECTLKLAIRTAITSGECDPQKILEQSITLKQGSKKVRDKAVTISLAEPELTRRHAAMLWLYSIPFEIKAGDQVLLTGALTHLRLPQRNGETDPAYSDLANEALAVNVELTCSKSGKLSWKTETSAQQAHPREFSITRPLDCFVWGYQKFRRNSEVNTAEGGRTND